MHLKIDEVVPCRQSFGRLTTLMQAVVSHAGSKGPAAPVDVFAVAGHVTMDAISLSIFGQDAGSTADLSAPKPRYAKLLDPGEPAASAAGHLGQH